MKKTLLILTAFIFTFVSLGAWDCGCAFAFDQKEVNVVSTEIMHDCHGEKSNSTKTQQNKSDNEETCCPGCQLTKANSNSLKTMEAVSQQSQSHAKFKTDVASNALYGINPSEQLKKKSSSWTAYGRSVSVYVQTPIYLLVQSLLI